MTASCHMFVAGWTNQVVLLLSDYSEFLLDTHGRDIQQWRAEFGCSYSNSVRSFHTGSSSSYAVWRTYFFADATNVYCAYPFNEIPCAVLLMRFQWPVGLLYQTLALIIFSSLTWDTLRVSYFNMSENPWPWIQASAFGSCVWFFFIRYLLRWSLQTLHCKPNTATGRAYSILHPAYGVQHFSLQPYWPRHKWPRAQSVLLLYRFSLFQ